MSRDAIVEGRIAGPDSSALIVATEWLSGIFMAPMTSGQVVQTSATPGQEVLSWMGEQLDVSAAAEALCRILDQDDPEKLAVHLQRRYTALFEGIFRHRAVLPYESAWQGQNGSTLGGESVVEMKAVLRALDLHVSNDCCEPPDHLAIELAALAAALRDDRDTVAADLVRRLQNWVPAFNEALSRQDPDGFYAAAGDLLLASIDKAPTALVSVQHATASVNEQREGAFA
ncbi:TorD/DmsD family molecular chaperone [Halomonas alimentaria]|uniref:Uncharacterized protein n=1 Tax=Halomonas alimentaria TaxID=147248 RepID=A0A7X4W5D0_9GAMM|nr:molecular chaperone TorD family protein [Halomonas alimentaria]NAW34629.1 hypothetical protein [Halomonas alimentaria]